MLFGTPVEEERKRRICVALWAYAYEIMHDSLVDDETFDRECRAIDLSISTGNKKLDNWFRKEFQPDTGLWVHKHPDKKRLHAIYTGIKEHMTTDIEFTLGQQKALAAKISADLDAHCVAKYSEGKRSHLGASLIGEECWRKVWYGFRWVMSDTYFDAKGKCQKGRMMRLFNRGHKEEFRFVEWLRGMGFLVEEFQADGKTQFRISDVRGHFGGSMDGMITFPQGYAGYANLGKMLLEFKTSSSKYFEKLKTNGVIIEKPQHFAQMCTYGKRYNLKYALYMCVNKDTDEIYYEIVKLDYSVADKMTAKAEQIINSQVPPPKLSENSAFFTCKMCSFASVCHGQAKYEKNCRSCVHAVAVDNAEWKCNVFNGIIPKEFIPQGCDQWTEAR